ncbi:hypothetical protein [Zhongshania borealis]|uniref:Lipoprotein n=1 Tax=Zhongshania borealis TaxID=889488 RepID=A0ABP7WRB5_9GAMM
MSKYFLLLFFMGISLVGCSGDPITSQAKADLEKYFVEEFSGYELGDFEMDLHETSAERGSTITTYKITGTAEISNDAVISITQADKYALVREAGKLQDVPFLGGFRYVTNGESIESEVRLDESAFDRSLESKSKIKNQEMEVVFLGSSREKELSNSFSKKLNELTPMIELLLKEETSRSEEIRLLNTKTYRGDELYKLQATQREARSKVGPAERELNKRISAEMNEELLPVETAKVDEINAVRKKGGLGWGERYKVEREIAAKYQPAIDEAKKKYSAMFEEQRKSIPEVAAYEAAGAQVQAYIDGVNAKVAELEKHQDVESQKRYDLQDSKRQTESWLYYVEEANKG